ncbi:hypothetical protein [Sphingomonas zeicaulis]|uniref:hypothetical protein n=1 Tax=Sphingomonas zeicaulis TaxID=1632740 RepID=UPI003D243195
MLTSLRPFAALREADALLAAHGVDAIAIVHEAMVAAVRVGDHRAADRLDRILQHVETAVDTMAVRHATG